MIATLTPSRGDRSQFLAFCKEQIERQTLVPDESYFITDPPTNGEFDLVKRIRRGYEMAKERGAERLYIWEDDDAMPSDYLQMMESSQDWDFIGYEDTLYYNIRNRTWMHQTHPKRSSLFCTGFRVSAMNDFIWPADHYLWLDIRLWEHARDKRKKVKLMSNNPCVGIKHNLGMCAGKSHKRILEHHDPTLEFLKSRVEEYQYEFYSKLKL